MADPSSTPPTFLEFSQTHGLSARLTKSLQRLNYLHPLPVQQTSVPLILSEGKDVLIQSSTGSGKTLGYLIPILQKLIQEVRRHASRLKNYRNIEAAIINATDYAPSPSFVSPP